MENRTQKNAWDELKTALETFTTMQDNRQTPMKDMALQARRIDALARELESFKEAA